MELTEEQMEYVMQNQRSPESAKGLADIVEKLAGRYPNKTDLNVTPEELRNMSLIANIGEYHPDMFVDGVSIYSKEFGKWDESEKGQKAKALNAIRGSKSVEMAQSIGIELTHEMIEAIESTSKGKSINLVAVLMKAAQTYKAVQQPRWSRGVQKEAAKNFEEVEEILKKVLEFMMEGQEIEPEVKDQLVDGIIESARVTYAMEKSQSVARSIEWDMERSLQMYGLDYSVGASKLTTEYFNTFFAGLTNEEILNFSKEVKELYAGAKMNEEYETEHGLMEIIEKYENPVKSSILKATEGITPAEAMDILEEMNPDKNKAVQH